MPCYLVACSKTKADKACQAKELYQGALFKKARAYAEARTSSWSILSAKYGLLAPDRVIPPYDETLTRWSKAQRLAWAERVFASLQEKGLPKTVVLLAGLKYREGLEPLLLGAGVRVEVPLRGLGIGQQLAFLRERLG